MVYPVRGYTGFRSMTRLEAKPWSTLKRKRNIHCELDASESAADSEAVRATSFAGVPFSAFEALPLESVRKLNANAPTKSCVINPLPTSVVKECLDELSPAISSSVNLSLEQGHFVERGAGQVQAQEIWSGT